MSTILLVEDRPDLGLYEAGLLEAAGHRVVRCGGTPGPLAACPMMRFGDCPLPDGADLILFSCMMFAPARGRTYRGEHLLAAYRAHPRYGRLPMVVVAAGPPPHVGGGGPFRVIEKFSGAGPVLRAVEDLLNGPPGPETPGPDASRRRASRRR